MKSISNFESVQAVTGEFNKPKAGGYIVKIINAVDVPLDTSTGKGDYLKIDYDIADGDFEGYYTELNDRFGGEYKTNFIRSYKEKALGMFKHFTNCVEDSNPGFHWMWDEKALKGMRVGVVLREEEYQKRDGSVGVRLTVSDIKTVDQIAAGEFKVSETKHLAKINTTAYNPYSLPKFEEIGADEELPF